MVELKTTMTASPVSAVSDMLNLISVLFLMRTGLFVEHFFFDGSDDMLTLRCDLMLKE